jgi:AbrB family looped-hinge helix DNA binding protein
MITKIDANGRVQLPIGLRCLLDLEEGDELAVDHLGDGTIILKKIPVRVQTGSANYIEAEMIRG